jgi:hypothetical protein
MKMQHKVESSVLLVVVQTGHGHVELVCYLLLSYHFGVMLDSLDGWTCLFAIVLLC